MKRTIYLIVAVLMSVGLYAQSTEHLHFRIDKDCYLAGEQLWIKVTVTDSLHRPHTLSKVAYVEIADTRQVHAQGKIALEDGTGWGCITLGQTMHTGTYRLTAYTRYMRNGLPDAFPMRLIGVINPNQALDEDDAEVLTDSAARAATPALPRLEEPLLTDRAAYNTRSRVTLRLPQLPADLQEATLAVTREDVLVLKDEHWDLSPRQSLVAADATASAAPSASSAEKARFVAECEGHIVTTRLIGNAADSVTASLACVGKDIRLFGGRFHTPGYATFYTHGITDMQDIVLTAIPLEEQPCRLEVVSPFAETLPDKLPRLRLSFDEEALLERNFGAQIRTIEAVDSLKGRDVLEQLYHLTPESTYNLDEYVRFNTVREVLLEFVMGVSTGRQDGHYYIKILQPDVRRFSRLKTLVLIDGVPVDDHEAVLDYTGRTIHYLHRYTGRYVFGGQLYEGIVSMITHRGTLPEFRLDAHSQQLAYEFPQQRPAFPVTAYLGTAERASRLPDFRHTLYWNPAVEKAVRGGEPLSFYTSDLPGRYRVLLQGTRADGTLWQAEGFFTVTDTADGK